MSYLPTILAALLAGAFAYLWFQERKKARKAEARIGKSLRQQKKRLRKEQDRLLNALSDAFFLIGPDGVILFANETTTELVAGRRVAGRNYREVFLDERLNRPIEDSLTSGRGVVHQVVLPQQASPRGIVEKRGETAWVIDVAPLNRNAKKTITRVVIRDITTEHLVEQVRKDFVANASHELRTPLSIINGYLENLVEGDIDNQAMLKRALTVMQKHGERIARIVEDMLVISRLESGEAAALNVSPFLFTECVEEVLDRLEPLIQQQKTKIRLKIEDESLALIGDRFYWTQVFFNLVENALKQNPRRPLTLEIGARFNGEDEVTLWVADNGVGIPGVDLPFIFRRFYRVEKHHSQDSIKGTGLGLSIVKRAVEAHGGTIDVTSVPGQRTAFSIHLPKEALATEEQLLLAAAGDGDGQALVTDRENEEGEHA
ncbi:ATP-binding protein [Roseibacillus persicicus]|uniref:sensor histidine kinase n=1 Tax=Roseibacillus persicicus TaxID=454148 RepID=UPI00398B8ACC